MDNQTTAIILVVLSALTLAVVILVLAVALRRRSDVEAAVSGTWIRLGLGETIGKIEREAQEIRNTHTTLERMLRTPAGRASFGELSLEVILNDQLPGEFFGLREKCFDGKIPDAHIRSTEGLICIDSKFPLDNFARMNECCDGDGQKAEFQKRFLRDTEMHLKKVAEDYVQPNLGTAAFALMYVPSEAVYYFLANEGYELLKRYTVQGVQVVSPLLLSHKIELLKMGIRAVRLNENAKEVLAHLQGLASRFKKIDDAWNIFHATHLRNLENKANELDEAYKRVRREFDKISNNTSENVAQEGNSDSVQRSLPSAG